MDEEEQCLEELLGRKPVDDKDDIEIEIPPIVYEDLNNPNPHLRTPCQPISFPLSQEDLIGLTVLTEKYNNINRKEGPEEERDEEVDESERDIMISLSAPQVGFFKRAFIFEIKPEDGAEPVERSIWINPTYRNAKDATLDEDYETCPSITMDNGIDQMSFIAGPLFRFNRIFYRANDIDGKIMEGEASGLLARVIQHEVDHLDGKMFTEFVQADRILPLNTYLEKKIAGTLESLQTGIVPEV